MSDLRLGGYDSQSFGPLFAVSDEGSAGQAVVDAAYASAKARALGAVDASTVGVILDGERMTSAGEVPIGPEEYAALNTVAAGRVPCTTNVGVRANVRLLQQLPKFSLPLQVDEAWVAKVCGAYEQFLHTVDGVIRPLMVRLEVPPEQSLAGVQAAVRKLEEARKTGRIGPATLHRFSLLLAFDRPIEREALRRIKDAIQVAAAAGLPEIAIDAPPLAAAKLRQGIQSLLNILDPSQAREVLREAHDRKVLLTYPYVLDVQSMARTIWTGLHTARTHGFAAGKYGLVPMTLGEQRIAIELITRWMSGWSAIPAFYVDTPLVTADDVIEPSRCVEAACLWLTMVREAGVSLVLFDSPDRISPRRLLRADDAAPDDPGVLTLADVDRIMVHARSVKVDVLWSGGITGGQAFDLAKRRVHGIFSTSSTARKIPVSRPFADDPRLAAENEPTESGIRRVHAVVQAGFLSTALASSEADLAKTIDETTRALLAAQSGTADEVLRRLEEYLERGWRVLHPAPPKPLATSSAPPVVVAPDAVRVFRGRRRSSLAPETFVEKLGSLFMPVTVQMQRLYGLTAYLPAVLPAGHAAELPDEIALVFYRTQGAYAFAKQCVGGRAYSELHDLVFDMPKSPSGFPQRFTGKIELDQPYHLFAGSVDWQLGAARMYVGTRRAAVPPEMFTTEVAKLLGQLERASGLDAAIFSVAQDWLICWVHGPGDAPPLPDFASIAERAFESSARPLQVSPDLSQPYEGFRLSSEGDFLNMRFSRP